MEQQEVQQNAHRPVQTIPLNNENKELIEKQSEQESPIKMQKTDSESKSDDIYTDEELRKFQIQGVISVIGGILLHFELGTFYVWGAISPYIAAWIREKDPSVTLSLMSLTFPIMGIAMTTLAFGIKLADRFGYKLMVGIGSFLFALSFLLNSFFQSIGSFIAIYCIFVGSIGGLLYMLPIVSGWRYFPHKRGLISGLTIGGYGFGAFIFTFICKAVANPHGLKPSVISIEDGKTVKYYSSEVGENVPWMLQVMAICYFILGIIATLMIRYPHEICYDKMLRTVHAVEARKSKDGIYHAPPYKGVTTDKECQTFLEGTKHPIFWFLVLLVLVSCTLGMLFSNYYKTYGGELGFDDSMLTIIGSVAGVMNGCSRFFWATLTDKTSFRFTFILISILNLITSAILPYNKNAIGYLILVAMVYLAEGGLLATYPIICAKIFGKKVSGLLYGAIFLMVGLSNMLGYLLYAFAKKHIDWEGIFWVCFGLNCVGLFMGIVLKEYGYDWRHKDIIQKEKDQELQQLEPKNTNLS